MENILRCQNIEISGSFHALRENGKEDLDMGFVQLIDQLIDWLREKPEAHIIGGSSGVQNWINHNSWFKKPHFVTFIYFLVFQFSVGI